MKKLVISNWLLGGLRLKSVFWYTGCMIPHYKQRVVILGAGFAGVACARALAAARRHDLEITVVDAKPYQLYHPTLYEVLCIMRRGITPAMVRATATIPLHDILPRGVLFRQAHVKYWDADRKIVHLDTGELAYNVLIIALGSTSEYFGVPGAAENSWAFKTFEDALRVHNALREQLARRDGPVNIVISGGGFTGVETAAELACLLRKVERQTERSGHVVVVEGCPQLLSGLNEKLAARVLRRLQHLGVEVRLSTMVKRVTAEDVLLDSGEKLKTRFVLWTAGVRACQLPGATKDLCGPKGRLHVDPFLRVAGNKNVYAIGDIACAADTSGKPLSQTAAFAIGQGKYVAAAILGELKKKPVKPYRSHFDGYVIPVGGKYAFFVTPTGFILEGFFAWVLRRFVDFAYWNSVLPWHKALRLWLRATRLFVKND